MSKVWFITGSSKGFGRIWAEAALERGDQVAATARNADTLTTLVEPYGENVLPLTLDVTDKAAIDEAIKQAHEHFGRLDVVVNNAGYGLFGAIEEVTEEQARDQIETNLFGAALGDPGGAADHARAGLGARHPGVVDRRRERVPDPRALPRVEVGARGLQPVARGRGRRLRDQGHDRRARRLLDRLARPVRGRRRRAARLRARARLPRALFSPLAEPATRRPPARRSSSSSTPTSRRCARSSAPARWT